jgi:hypothetical protein
LQALETPEALKTEIRKLLKVRELWARSYELFICRWHSRSDLAEGMSVECGKSARVGDLTIHNYWQGDDFLEIEHEIEEVFRKIGWLIKPNN